MRRVVSAVLLLCLLVGCGFPTQESPEPLAKEDQPGTTTSDSRLAEPDSESVTVWFVRDDLLVSAIRRVPSPANVSAVIATLAAGVSSSDTNRGLRSAIPDSKMVVGATSSGGTAIVQLASEFLDIPSGDQVLALGQIVYTVTDLRGIGRVRFEIDGVAVAVPLPAGDSTRNSVSRDDFAELASRS